MDIVIKNIESLRNDIDGHTQTPQRVVVDFSKAGTDEFAQLFFNSCEEYDEAEDGFLLCDTCKYQFVDEDKDPCRSCLDSASRKMNWESKGPNLKELYKKYVEVGESYIVPNEDIKKAMESEKTCRTCKYHDLEVYEEPCQSCIGSYLSLDEMNPNWEPAEPTLKEVTERMQSEFDATGKDVAYFMNHRVKPGCGLQDN